MSALPTTVMTSAFFRGCLVGFTVTLFVLFLWVAQAMNLVLGISEPDVPAERFWRLTPGLLGGCGIFVVICGLVNLIMQVTRRWWLGERQYNYERKADTD